MPKHLIDFLTSGTNLTDEQVAAQLPALSHEAPGLKLSDNKLEPIHPMFDESSPAGSQPHPCDYPQGFDRFIKTLQALAERYPFRAAVLEFQTLVRVLRASCAQQNRGKLQAIDYTRMLCLLEEIDKLTTQCQNCPVSPDPSNPTYSMQ